MNRLAEKGILARERIGTYDTVPYTYVVLLRRQDLLLARIEQILAGADEVERQYIAAAIRGGHLRA